MKKINEFLSTPSARRATYSAVVDRLKRIISIHALREEGDLLTPLSYYGCLKFLSTPSARRATNGANNGVFALNLFLSTPSARRATGWYS